VVFFFQAEDGIRDFHVTGVQTCALPICAAVPLQARVQGPHGRRGRRGYAEGHRGCQGGRLLYPGVITWVDVLLAIVVAVLTAAGDRKSVVVGEGWRARWVPCDVSGRRGQ